jgi:hypothetical protein
MNTSEKQVSRLVAELESFGCVVVVRNFGGGSMSNLYTFPDDPPIETNMSLEGGQKCPTKEKTYKETKLKNAQTTTNKTKSEADAEAFEQAVKDIYPKGCRKPEWSNFTKKAQTSLSSKPSREMYLSAVRGYASTNPNHGYVKQPTSLIEAMDYYVDLGGQPEPRQSKLLELLDKWGEL